MALFGGLFGGGSPMQGQMQRQNAQLPEGFSQLGNFTPEQQKVLDQLLQLGSQGVQNLAQGFAPIKQRAVSEFQQQTIPTIAERFTAMGGTRKGSGSFEQSLGQAGSDLSERLAALESQYNLQQQQPLQSLLQMGLTPRSEYTYQQPSPGFAESAGVPLVQALSKIIPLLVGSGSGGLSALSSLFGGQ